MKWKHTVQPKHLDRRERIRFAWFPLRGTDGLTYWLEPVKEWQEFLHYMPLSDGWWSTLKREGI